MTDTTAGETPVEPVLPLPEAASPEAAAELDAGRLEVDGPAPAEAQADAPVLPPIEHPIGPLRQTVLDHLLDTVDAGPQSVAQILAAMPAGTTRNTTESCIRRELEAGRIERTSPGHYVLAKPKPPAPSKPAAPPPPTPIEEATWFSALEAWINDPETWDRERFGPRPDEPSRRIPAGVVAKGVDRNRKRQERRKDAEAAATKQEAADAELRKKLLAATGGNYTLGPGIEDLTPIKVAIELVPLDIICRVISWKVNKLCFPANSTLSTWRDRKLLQAIAEEFCASVIVPRSVDAWAAAGTAPQKPVERAEALPATQQPPRKKTHLRRYR